MFHVKRDGDAGVPGADDSPPEAPDVASRLFGATVDRAEAYCASLATDGVVLGLIGPREVPRLWERHILNCAVIGEAMPPSVSVVDIGSGAGLPGIPLALARPDLRITLVEPLLRRSDFLQRIVDELELDVRVIRGRAEEKSIRGEVGGADVVTSRAVAPLERLTKWSAPLIADGGRLIAIKGSSAEEEIARDGDAARRLGIVDLHVKQCGVEALEVPTTVVVGTKRGTSGASKRRAGASKRKR
ncbi:16S rRNA (guanine(527)-N(7))-methyltransferase RsmG [Gordonia sp. LSe1-13]|uniref:Ribosomal RNA small subunit methyltransferase G n=1 Tax=Gordonia sesuvii TaxID=3116777 RepID=A0ABU7MFL7_9ACTN|nr:16S rRNA (guanine(527)-N(7))-methyltransferase RsmG [Gordonia sp. LSe1-13]